MPLTQAEAAALKAKQNALVDQYTTASTQPPPVDPPPVQPPPTGQYPVNDTLPWTYPGEIRNTGFKVGQTFVAKFVAPIACKVTVTVAEFGSAPMFRYLRLALVPADVKPYLGSAIGSTAMVTLDVTAGTTYYAIMSCDLRPGGPPSGPVGAQAGFVMALNHP